MTRSPKKSRGVAEELYSEPPAFESNVNVFESNVKPDPSGTVDDTLEPEEIGIMIYCYAPKHCKSFRKLAAKQFLEGKVKEKGTILLPDGQTIKAGATIKTAMKPDLKRMLIDGVFLAGKVSRKV